jgi:hypothetical protein
VFFHGVCGVFGGHKDTCFDGVLSVIVPDGVPSKGSHALTEVAHFAGVPLLTSMEFLDGDLVCDPPTLSANATAKAVTEIATDIFADASVTVPTLVTKLLPSIKTFDLASTSTPGEAQGSAGARGWRAAQTKAPATPGRAAAHRRG